MHKLTPFLLSLGFTAGTTSSQNPTRPEHLVVSGESTGFWVTTMGASPIAKGQFRMQFAGDKAYVRVDLPGVGAFSRGTDGETTWAVDSEAGPVFREGDAATADAIVFALLRGDLATAKALDRREASAREAGWTEKGGELRAVEVASRTALGEVVTCKVEFRGWSDRNGHEYPAKLWIEQGHRRFEFEVAEYSTDADDVDTELFTLDPKLAEAARNFRDKEPGADAVECKFVDKDEQHTAYMRKTVKFDEISKELGQMLPKIMMHVIASGVATTGAPYSRYHSFDGKQFDLECGVTVEKKCQEGDGVRAGTLPKARCATTWHIGPYQELGDAHTRLRQWATDNGVLQDGGLWEIYWTDPGLEPDPRKWRTQLVMPVKAQEKR